MHCTKIVALGGWGILAHIWKVSKIAAQILDISSCQCHVFLFRAFLLHWHYNAHEIGAGLGQLEPKCLFKVQYLNNRFFAFFVKFLSIMRRSSRKCPMVTDHEKLIATLSQKDGALRGAWDILNGALKGPTQAEKKWLSLRTVLPTT